MLPDPPSAVHDKFFLYAVEADFHEIWKLLVYIVVFTGVK